jgi:tRNA uridine 5-carbamoylmethylation protein Kti12
MLELIPWFELPTMTTKTVLLLMGLPGSGKSTLSKKILESLPGSLHVEYDAVANEMIVEECDELQAWRLSRHAALKRLDYLLGERGPTILMDDNFHLSSMRKQVYHVCQRYPNVRFGILWLDTPLEICLERNQQRLRLVPQDVIIKMHTTLEPPKHYWELNSYLKIDDKTTMERIVAFLSTLAIVEPPVDPALQDEQRRLTRENRVHLMDKTLRLWVGCVALVHRPSVGKANEARKVLLAEVRVVDTAVEATALMDKFLDSVTGSDWTEDQVSVLHAKLQATM